MIKLFIDRPVATTVLTMALIVFGIIAYRALPISELPEIDYATIQVSASVPGADPETMANTVATPLEKQFSAIAGIDSMNSTNTAGKTSITLQFDLSRNIDSAAQDVQTAIAQTSRSLPPEMQTPPTLRKVNPAASPIMYLALTGDNLPITKLDELSQTYIAQRLSMISGVAQVQVYGSQEFAVRIHLNPDAMTSRNLSNTDVINAVKAANAAQPTGLLKAADRTYTIKAKSSLTHADAFNQVIIHYSDGAPIRLQDVAKAEDSVADDQAAAWYQKKRGILLAIQRQPGSNTMGVIDGIHQILPEITQKLPGGAKLEVVYDRSYSIRSALSEMKLTLFLSVFLVAGVILLFLGQIAPMMIAMISLPISLLATFAAMYFLGYSLNILSLMGLVLAVGFIVDDAIVVLENIVRHLEKGMDRVTAALKGAQEIVFTVLSMTLSLVAVFIPLLFMGGLLGRLFHEFAMVVGISILISGIVALTLTPMLCSRWLKSDPLPESGEHHHKTLFPWFERGFLVSKKLYENTLLTTLNYPKTIVIGTGIIFLITLGLFSFVSKGFIPDEDAGVLNGWTEVPAGLSFDEFSKRQQAVAKIIRADPSIEAVASSISNNYSGRLTVRLKPPSERTMPLQKTMAQLRQEIKKVAGIQVYLNIPPSIRAGSVISSSNYQFVLQGTDLDQLQAASKVLLDKMKALPGIQETDTDLQDENPEVRVKIEQDRAAALGVSPTAIQSALYDAYGTRQISSIYTPTDTYQVISDIDPRYQANIGALDRIYVRSFSGDLVPMSSVATLEEGVGLLSVNHYGQLPSVFLSFNLKDGVSLGDMTGKIESLAKETLPAGVTGSFAGSAQVFQNSTHTLPILLLITVFVIYVVLAILYEHFIHPLTILTAVPLAAFGALFMLWLFHMELDVFSFVGLILLIGLVKKNGIMMVDFAIVARRHQQISAHDAIVQACLVRFRPIMMTTLTAILATLPLALAVGSGGESRQPMGVAVVGGLLFSQMLTLYVTPVFYLVMEGLFSKKRQGENLKI